MSGQTTQTQSEHRTGSQESSATRTVTTKTTTGGLLQLSANHDFDVGDSGDDPPGHKQDFYSEPPHGDKFVAGAGNLWRRTVSINGNPTEVHEIWFKVEDLLRQVVKAQQLEIRGTRAEHIALQAFFNAFGISTATSLNETVSLTSQAGVLDYLDAAHKELYFALGGPITTMTPIVEGSIELPMTNLGLARSALSQTNRAKRQPTLKQPSTPSLPEGLQKDYDFIVAQLSHGKDNPPDLQQVRELLASRSGADIKAMCTQYERDFPSAEKLYGQPALVSDLWKLSQDNPEGYLPNKLAIHLLTILKQKGVTDWGPEFYNELKTDLSLGGKTVVSAGETVTFDLLVKEGSQESAELHELFSQQTVLVDWFFHRYHDSDGDGQVDVEVHLPERGTSEMTGVEVRNYIDDPNGFRGNLSTEFTFEPGNWIVFADIGGAQNDVAGSKTITPRVVMLRVKVWSAEERLRDRAATSSAPSFGQNLAGLNQSWQMALKLPPGIGPAYTNYLSDGTMPSHYIQWVPQGLDGSDINPELVGTSAAAPVYEQKQKHIYRQQYSGGGTAFLFDQDGNEKPATWYLWRPGIDSSLAQPAADQDIHGICDDIEVAPLFVNLGPDIETPESPPTDPAVTPAAESTLTSLALPVLGAPPTPESAVTVRTRDTGDFVLIAQPNDGSTAAMYPFKVTDKRSYDQAFRAKAQYERLKGYYDDGLPRDRGSGAWQLQDMPSDATHAPGKDSSTTKAIPLKAFHRNEQDQLRQLNLFLVCTRRGHDGKCWHLIDATPGASRDIFEGPGSSAEMNWSDGSIAVDGDNDDIAGGKYSYSVAGAIAAFKNKNKYSKGSILIGGHINPHFYYASPRQGFGQEVGKDAPPVTVSAHFETDGKSALQDAAGEAGIASLIMAGAGLATLWCPPVSALLFTGASIAGAASSAASLMDKVEDADWKWGDLTIDMVGLMTCLLGGGAAFGTFTRTGAQMAKTGVKQATHRASQGLQLAKVDKLWLQNQGFAQWLDEAYMIQASTLRTVATVEMGATALEGVIIGADTMEKLEDLQRRRDKIDDNQYYAEFHSLLLTAMMSMGFFALAAGTYNPKGDFPDQVPGKTASSTGKASTNDTETSPATARSGENANDLENQHSTKDKGGTDDQADKKKSAETPDDLAAPWNQWLSGLLGDLDASNGVSKRKQYLAFRKQQESKLEKLSIRKMDDLFYGKWLEAFGGPQQSKRGWEAEFPKPGNEVAEYGPYADYLRRLELWSVTTVNRTAKGIDSISFLLSLNRPFRYRDANNELSLFVTQNGVGLSVPNDFPDAQSIAESAHRALITGDLGIPHSHWNGDTLEIGTQSWDQETYAQDIYELQMSKTGDGPLFEKIYSEQENNPIVLTLLKDWRAEPAVDGEVVTALQRQALTDIANGADPVVVAQRFSQEAGLAPRLETSLGLDVQPARQSGKPENQPAPDIPQQTKAHATAQKLIDKYLRPAMDEYDALDAYSLLKLRAKTKVIAQAVAVKPFASQLVENFPNLAGSNAQKFLVIRQTLVEGGQASLVRALDEAAVKKFDMSTLDDPTTLVENLSSNAQNRASMASRFGDEAGSRERFNSVLELYAEGRLQVLLRSGEAAARTFDQKALPALLPHDHLDFQRINLAMDRHRFARMWLQQLSGNEVAKQLDDLFYELGLPLHKSGLEFEFKTTDTFWEATETTDGTVSPLTKQRRDPKTKQKMLGTGRPPPPITAIAMWVSLGKKLDTLKWSDLSTTDQDTLIQWLSRSSQRTLPELRAAAEGTTSIDALFALEKADRSALIRSIDEYPDWLTTKAKQMGVEVEDVQWKTLSPQEKEQLVAWATYYQRFSRSRKISGLQYDEAVGENIERRVEHATPTPSQRGKRTEAHSTKAGDAGDNLREASAQVDELAEGERKAVHGHLATAAPNRQNIVEALHYVDYYQRLEKLVAMIWGTKFQLRKREKQGWIFFNFLSARKLADINRYATGVSREVPFGKTSAIGFREDIHYDQADGDAKAVGWEIRKGLTSSENSEEFIRLIQRQIITGDFGGNIEGIRALASGKSADEASAALANTHYNQAIDMLLQTPPSHVAEHLNAPRGSSTVRDYIDSIAEQHYGLKMLVFDWSNDLLFANHPSALMKLQEVQVTCLKMLQDPATKVTPVRQFIRESGIVDVYAESVGLPPQLIYDLMNDLAVQGY